MRTKLIATVGLLGLAGAALAGCSGDDSPGTEETADGPITLDYWAWGTSQDGLVDAWNSAHPDIQVKRTDAGGGTDSSTKLLTATRAGNAPDAALVEFQTLPAMIVGDVAADITQYVSDDVRSAFTDSVWSLTTFNDAIYGIPQDVGPMAFVFNQARFDELGVAVPTTWAEFATAAEQVRAADPDTYIATFNTSEFGFFAGMAQQAGAEWWSVDGDTWSVGIDDKASLEVADYWQDLIDRDLVKVEDLLTPQWNQEVNEGKVLSWPSALWAPGVIYGVAEGMAGQWAMAPLPQWTPGDTAVAYQGGSAVIATTSSKHPKEAAEFAAFINSSQEGADVQLETGQYPASLLGQQTATSSPPPQLMPQQTDFWQLASTIAADTIPNISWGPNVNVASSAFQDAMAKAVENGTPLRDALTETQQVVVDDMKTTGFTVAD
ncbi:sugar ABC transporter substrate-binding protein [Actinomycetota bacterium]|nr:sugar ABC transporter substrate-binding protein [Actinomycetota bacterium]